MKTPTALRGFTFIELLVTVAIMMVVLGGALVGYIQFNQRQTVLQTSLRIQAMIKSARVKAQIRDTPAGCSEIDGSSSLYGYMVSITNTTAELFAWCGASQASAAPFTPASDAYTLQNGVTSAQNHQILFYTLHGGTSLASDQVVIVSNGTQSYRFSVTTGGEITEGCWGTDKCN